MRAGLAWSGSILAACAVLASAGAAAAQGEPSSAMPALPDDVRASLVRMTLEGFVLAPDGSPAEGAVVVSSAGGRAVTDVAGNYRLEVEVPLEATSLQVTAVGNVGANQSASTSVVVNARSMTRVDPLRLALGGSCSPSWRPTFEGQGTDGYAIQALTSHDDGGGPALYVGGIFTTAGGVVANGIAEWDGSGWTALGSGMGGTDPYVYDLAVHDDGGGPALYAGGWFTTAGGVTVNRIARWNGSNWAAVGSGMDGSVSALVVHDDGGGPALYAGGSFTTAGGVPASRIARWNGSNWAAVGSGMDNSVYALAVYDDGAGPALYAGGAFRFAEGRPASRIAKWNGSSWAGLQAPLNNGVGDLTVFDDGSGPALYAGGSFTTAGGVPANGIAKWNGSTWAAVGSGMGGISFPSVRALAVHDDGSGPVLYAGGAFTSAGSSAANRIASWDGTSWAALGSGLADTVLALTSHDDGSGPALYAGGYFRAAGGSAVNQIAKWNGSTWAALGSGMNSLVIALSSFDDGSGPALYAGGEFFFAGGHATSGIAKWDGSSWAALGSGAGGVQALTVHDDGSGPALYAGGNFTSAGGVQANFIARWNGTSWSALGSGRNRQVYALAVYDDGGGTALYAGGAGVEAADRIAKWDGTSWSALGSGVGGMNRSVSALAVHDDGSGPALYAGGNFTSAGGVPANGIARWDGSSWTALGSGVSGLSLPTVYALIMHDDGGGPALYAGGAFTTAGGAAANRIARWNGSSWSALGSGMNDTVRALTVHDDGTGPALFAGGAFTSAVDSGDSFLAKWGLPIDLDPPALSCPSSVIVRDELSSPPGEVVSFSVTASDCRDPAPSVVCVPPSGSFFPRGTTLVTCSATDAAGNAATCRFQVIVAPKARPR